MTQKFVRYKAVSAIEGCPLSGVHCRMLTFYLRNPGDSENQQLNSSTLSIQVTLHDDMTIVYAESIILLGLHWEVNSSRIKGGWPGQITWLREVF